MNRPSSKIRNLAKKSYFIGSGKGGVGKSTVAVNLAVALAKKGLEVGLLDADLYGPSIPIMMGLRRLSPSVYNDSEGKEKIIPFTKFGVKILSIGFFIEEARSIIWRGPMLHGILEKMVDGTEWGNLDILLIDLPPGTGDVPLSLSQIIEINGALLVCTPQEVAILDAVKAINAFDQLEIPIIGLIENMSGFTCPSTKETFPLFGEGKAAELASRFQIPLLGTIPILMKIRQGGDEGFPSALYQGDEHAGSFFCTLAAKIAND